MILVRDKAHKGDKKDDLHHRLQSALARIDNIDSPSLKPTTDAIKSQIDDLQQMAVAQTPVIPDLAGTGWLYRRVKKHAYSKQIKASRKQLTHCLTKLKALESRIDKLSRQHEKLCSEESAVLNMLRDFLETWTHFSELYGYVVTLASPDKLFVGVSNTGQVLSITDKERLEHQYILGKTGVGKSKLLESMIIQDLLNGRGGTLIDPFGSLFRELSSFVLFYNDLRTQLTDIQQTIEAFLSKYRRQIEHLSTSKEKIPTQTLSLFEDIVDADLESIFPPLRCKIIDLSEQASFQSPNPYRINPFQQEEGEALNDLTDVLIRSIERHTGQDSSETPQLATNMEGLFSHMITEGKQLTDLLPTIDLLAECARPPRKNKPSPQQLLKSLESQDNPTAKQAAWTLRFLLKFSSHEFNKAIHSLVNRLRLFNNPVVYNFLNTPETTLHLEQEVNGIDEQGRAPFLLFHIPTDDSKSGMVATFLLSKIDKIIRKRTEAQKRNPFFVYVDEFPEFVDLQLAKNFAQTRQFGLSYTIAHQNFDQLKESDPEGVIMGTAFKNCSTKLLMQVSGDDAEYVVKQCFELTGKMEEVTYSTSTGNTTAIGYRVGKSITETKTRSESSSSSTSEKWSKTFSSTVGKSTAQAIGNSTSQTDSTGKSSGRSDNQNSSETRSLSRPWSDDGTTSTGSVISMTQQQNSSQAHGTSTSNTTTSTDNQSTSEGNQTGGGKTEGTGQTTGSSDGFSKQFGLSLNLGNSSSTTINHRFYSLTDERTFLTQEVQSLPKREFFICRGLEPLKARTLDSLIVKLELQLQPIIQAFYPELTAAQNEERQRMVDLLASSKTEMAEDLVDTLVPDQNSQTDKGAELFDE